MPKSQNGYLFPPMNHADELLGKWGITPVELNWFVENLELTPFILMSKRKNPENNELMYFVKESKNGISAALPRDSRGDIDVSKVVFHADQIFKTEKKHAHLCMRVVDEDFATDEKLEVMPSSADMHIVDLETQLTQARQEIARLTLEVERLTVIGNGDGAEPLECATCRAESPHSDEWTIDVECAVSFACVLMREGERGSTDYHEAEWKTRRGAIRKRAFEAFRRALPDHLKEADPRKK